jgi:AcrR family transcriptional regulator
VNPNQPYKLRADAERNRQALLSAARAAFRERGLGVALDEIARRAGVGNATLYRRFPTRRDLIFAVFVDRLRDYVDAVEEALRAPDPWIGFRDYVQRLCAMQADDHGFADLLTIRPPDDGEEEFEALRMRAQQGFFELVERAQAHGSLRADFEPEDFVVLLMANIGVIRRTTRDAPASSPRFVALWLDGLHQEAASPTPPPPTRAATIAAMRTGWTEQVSDD